MPLFEKFLTRTVGTLAIVSIAACQPPVTLGTVPDSIQTDVAFSAIRTDVFFIGDTAQEGRAVGSRGSNRVAEYIVERYKALKLAPAFPPACNAPSGGCGGGYFQPFTYPNARNAKNIGAIVRGTDPILKGEYVVIGAHYDHVGRSATLSLDPKMNDEIRPGADDNASGTAAVMELARRFTAHPARRSILVLHFDAEEQGLLGSIFFVGTSPVPGRSMKFMLNLDMVGRLSKGGLEVDKASLMYDDPELLAVVDSAANAEHIKHSFTKKIDGRSDHSSFRRADVSALSFFTGFHGDYHRTTDVVSKLDVRGIGLVTDVAEAVVRFAADRK